MRQASKLVIGAIIVISAFSIVATLRASPPKEAPESRDRLVSSEHVEIGGDVYKAQVVETRWLRTAGGDSEFSTSRMLDSILYIERVDADEAAPRRAVWWSTTPELRRDAVTGRAVYGICTGQFEGREAILLAIGNSYYHGVSVVIIDPKVESVPPPSATVAKRKPFELKRPFHAKSQLKVLRIRDLDKLPPNGSLGVSIKMTEETIRITVNHAHGKVSNLEYEKSALKWIRLDD